MSIFNVGAGREPAEIGVAEYQKPDYQQFEKLANINMALKEHELEKAQRKTKEWGDILNTDFSTKYAVEQAQYVKKNIDAIKSNLIDDYKKNNSVLDDPAYMMQVKARLNQVKGMVKALDEQAENVIKEKEDYEKDTKGIMYDKKYTNDYFKAQDDPIGFAKNNPDSEVGKNIQTIINTPQIQSITDPDDKRIAIRASLQAMPKKRGTIATDISYKGKDLGFDIYDADSNTKGSNRYSRVSEVSAINQAMNYALQSADSNANKSFAQIVGDRLEQQYGSNLDAYKQQLRAEYADKYNKFQEQYKGDGNELPRETLNSMKSPDKLTDEDLFAFEYSKQTAPALMKKAEMSTTKNIVNVRTGEGAKNQPSGITSNQVLKLSNNFTTSGVVTSMQPKDDNKQIDTDIVYGVTDAGVTTRITSKGGATGAKSKMKDVRTTLVMVNKNTGQMLTNEQKEKVLKDPSKYKNNVVWKTGISIEQEVQNKDGSTKKQMGLGWGEDNTTAMAQLIDEFETGGYDKSSMWMPASQYDNTFTLEEGIAIENGDNSIRRSAVYGKPKKKIKRTKK